MRGKFFILSLVACLSLFFIVACGDESSRSQSSGNTNSFLGVPLPDNTRQIPLRDGELPGSVPYGTVLGFFVSTADYSASKDFFLTKMKEKGYDLKKTELSTTDVPGTSWTYVKGLTSIGDTTPDYEKVLISLAGPLRGNNVATFEKYSDAFKDKLKDGDKVITISYYSKRLELETIKVKDLTPSYTATTAPKR